MHRKIIFAVMLVLAFLPAGTPLALAADEQYQIVRVKLSIGSPTELSFFADGDYTINADGAGLERQLYTVKLEGGALNLYLGAEKLASGASIKLVRHAAASGRNNFIWMYNERAQGLLGYDKFRYLGDMEFLIENGHIIAVNHVYIEDYLYGVVPWEMSSSNSFPIEALKAQAVAARSYAETHLGRPGAYDMVDTSANQVYNGYSLATTAAVSAVDQTARTVLTYGGTVIEALFSASNGGYTDIPYHRWGSGADLAYYQFSDDPFDAANQSSRYETIFFPVSFSPDYGAVTVSASSGTPDKMKAIACIKQAIFDNEAFRAAHPEIADRNGFELIGVSNLTARDYDINGSEDHSRVPAYSDNRCVDFIKATGDFTVLIGGTTSETVTGVTVDLRYLDGSLPSTNNEFKAFNIDALTLFVIQGDPATGYSISQKRFGHGIGLSQRGAEQRANTPDANVNTFDKILGFYYPGTALTAQGYSAPALTPASVPDNSNASITKDMVNIRNGPATSYSSLNKLPQGARIEVVQTNAAVTGNIVWHKIYYGGQYAYVAASVGAESYISAVEPGGRKPVTVSFETNGGSAVPALSCSHADGIDAPPSTSRPGFILEGWYTDAALTARASFPCIVTRDTTFYAKWVQSVCTVTFDAQGGTSVEAVQKGYGETIPSEPVTSRSGFNFTGWYTASGQRVLFPYTVTGDAALYAGWEQQAQSNCLRGVGLSCGSLNRGFIKTATSYKITIGENDAAFTLTPYKEYDGASMTINGKPYSSYTVSLANGKSATITVKVKYLKKTKTYKFSVTRAKSSNNALSALTASGGSLNRAFDPNVLNYTLTLDENTKSAAIKAVAAAGKLAAVSPASAKVSLNNGQSKDVRITVKAQSGAKRTYTIRVVRAASTNADLKSLRVSGLSPRFSPGVVNYTVVLPAKKNSVSISAAAAGYKAAVYIDGAKKSSRKITLANGQSVVVRVTVVSQSGRAKEYTVTVMRQ